MDDAQILQQVKDEIGEDNFRQVVDHFKNGYIGLADLARIPRNELDNLHQLGRLLISKKEYERAAKTLAMLVHICPHSGEYWASYGVALQNWEQPLKARTAYAVACQLLPEPMRFHIYAAECELMLQNPQWARDVLEPVFHMKTSNSAESVELLQRAKQLRILLDNVASGPSDKAAVNKRVPPREAVAGGIA